MKGKTKLKIKKYREYTQAEINKFLELDKLDQKTIIWLSRVLKQGA